MIDLQSLVIEAIRNDAIPTDSLEDLLRDHCPEVLEVTVVYRAPVYATVNIVSKQVTNVNVDSSGAEYWYVDADTGCIADGAAERARQVAEGALWPAWEVG